MSFLRELEINGGSGFSSLNYFLSLKAFALRIYNVSVMVVPSSETPSSERKHSGPALLALDSTWKVHLLGNGEL